MGVLYINLTYLCNNDCIFCAADKQLYHQKVAFISLRDIQNAFEHNSLRGHETKAVLNGGEPTMHPDLIAIIEYLHRLGCYIVLFTNGVMLKDRGYAEKLLQVGVNKISIALHGSRADSHDVITKRIGSFTSTCLGLDHLSQLKSSYHYELEQKIVLCKSNVDEISQIWDVIQKRWKPDSVLINGMVEGETAISNDEVIPWETLKGKINPIIDHILDTSNYLVRLYGIPLCFLEKSVIMKFLLQRLRKNDSQTNFNIQKSYYLDCYNREINSNNNIDAHWWKHSFCGHTECRLHQVCLITPSKINVRDLHLLNPNILKGNQNAHGY